MTYKAEILADSIASGARLTTFCITFPRFILAEFNTHRVLSRNSASSRAIPVEKRVAQVRESPFVPEAFGKNKSGMQAAQTLEDRDAADARDAWLRAANYSCHEAQNLANLKVHKEHANRIAEPFAWHTAVVTATEWENFFRLRTHKAAQPEMQIIAKMMREAYGDNEPVPLAPGEWHLPYVDWVEFDSHGSPDTNPERNLPIVQQLALSVVRCAAVSFERQGVQRTHEQVRTRHDEMVSMAHWSPFEHQAKVATEDEIKKHALYKRTDDGDFVPVSIGNLKVPFLQYRKTFEGEAVWEGGES